MAVAGLPSTGAPERSDENGSGSTQRKGAGLIATDATASPRPARISVIRPPNEWPMITGRRWSLRMIDSS